MADSLRKLYMGLRWVQAKHVLLGRLVPGTGKMLLVDALE